MSDKLLEGLFRWSHDFTIKDSLGNDYISPSTNEPIVVYQRIIGDAELSLARETALRASALKRKQLSDPNSLDRLTLIPDYNKLDRDSVLALIIINELADLREKANRELVFPYPEPPKSDASLEEQEKYQSAVDSYFETRTERIRDATEILIELRKKELQGLTDQELRRLHEESAINTECRETMLITFNEMVTYLATYEDPEFKERAFSSFHSFRATTSNLKQQLIEKYALLEIDGNKLKK